MGSTARTSGADGRLGDSARLRRLRDTGLLDGAPCLSLDRLARAAAHQVRAARGQVSLVAADRRVVAGHAGPPLRHSFCRIVVDTDGPLLVSDARTDDRVAGHPAIADGVIAYAGFPLRSADGYPLGAFCVLHDQPRDWEPRALLLVEDLAAAAETELHLRSEAAVARRLRAVLDGCHDAYVAIDARGDVRAWNAAAEDLFGYPAADAVGHPVADLIVPDRFRDAHLAGLARLHAGAVSELAGQRIELAARNRSGDEFPIEMTLQADPDGPGPLFHAFLHDISERRRAEDLALALAEQRERLLADQRAQNEQLRRLDRLKDELVALVSHELRNPLGVIRSYTETLLEDPGLSADQRHLTETIDRRSAHMQHLVDDLLDMARLEAGELHIDLEPMSVSRLLREVAQSHRPAADAKSLTIVVDAPRHLPARADPVRLRQVLDNLLSNAVKYTPDGGLVTIAARLSGDRVVATVADTGIGIPADQYPHLFDRFFRASNAVAHGIKGTGLGLAISRAIVEAHGGTLTAAPAPGGGSVFTVTLPAL